MNVISFRAWNVSEETQAAYANYRPSQEDRQAIAEHFAEELRVAQGVEAARIIEATDTRADSIRGGLAG